MSFEDKIQIEEVQVTEDANLNVVETSNWRDLGKCRIFVNSKATSGNGQENQAFRYSYEVLLLRPQIIPKENAVIRLTSRNGAIDGTFRVVGFVPLKRWVKIWVL